jgi:Raf kinase inhibitor-like YbhB/YbcL family protein
MTLTISSTAFQDGGDIPLQYTCDGMNISPSLAWSGAPAGTESFALIVDDPDAPDPQAPRTVWVHWLLYNLPASINGLAEGVSALPIPANTGKNDFGRVAYGGPCPPIGKHRYFFKLYALDTLLADLGKPTKAQLEKAMAGHIVDHAQLMGTYQRHR